ncbi:MAG: Single-stranded DNA binding protein [Halobacteriales archaeon]
MSDTQEVSEQAASIAEEVDADPDEVEERLKNLLEYSVPLEEAERTVRRRYGSETAEPDEAETADLADLSTGDARVSVEAVVVSAGRRSIRVDGDDTVITEGELSDETGVISYTAWDQLSAEPGDTVRVEGEVREWDGEPQVNIDSDADVVSVDDGVEPAREPYGVRSLAELESGDRAVTLEVGVVDSDEKTIQGRDGETTITAGTFGDGSGRLPFTDWENRTLDEGASVRVGNAYVNEYRGIPQVNMGEYTTVETSEDVDVSHTPPETDVAEAVEKGGDFDVVVRGNVLSVKEGSGLIERCPECGRVVQKGQCRVHGDVDAEPDMRTKAVLDDGTGAVTLVVGRELTEDLYDGTLEDAREEARDAMDKTAVTERIADNTVGRCWRVRGNVSVGDYGANMNVSEMEEANDDPADEAREVLDEF